MNKDEHERRQEGDRQFLDAVLAQNEERRQTLYLHIKKYLEELGRTEILPIVREQLNLNGTEEAPANSDPGSSRLPADTIAAMDDPLAIGIAQDPENYFDTLFPPITSTEVPEDSSNKDADSKDTLP
uniref:CID domain-containing protein n=1 Tax=Steinernema glaseri TaxID=37863 RepID=A0A1I7ZZE7_9BILA